MICSTTNPVDSVTGSDPDSFHRPLKLAIGEGRDQLEIVAMYSAAVRYKLFLLHISVVSTYRFGRR